MSRGTRTKGRTPHEEGSVWLCSRLVAALSPSRLRRRRRRGGRRARPRRAKLDKVTLQLKWVTQAQFAGYYAALEKGYYKDEGLDVDAQARRPRHHPGAGRRERPGRVRASTGCRPPRGARQGQRPRQHRAGLRPHGHDRADLEGQRHHDVAEMKGKKVGVWCCGNEFELFAALTKNGIDPKNKGRHDRQPAVRHEPLPQNQVDAAAAMTYNELAQVLETKNPKTGQALHARRPERDHDGGRGTGDARGRRLRRRQRGSRTRRTRTIADAVPEGVLQGLDLLPRPPGRLPQDRPRQRPDARRRATSAGR